MEYKIKYFSTYATVTEYHSANVIRPNVSYIEDSGDVYYHPYIKGFTGVILYEDTDNNLVKTTDILNAGDGYTAIGIEVIGDGFLAEDEPARYMSVKAMSVDSPNSGANTFSGIYFGGYSQDISDVLTSYTEVLNGSGKSSIYFTNDALYFSNNAYVVDTSKYKNVHGYGRYGILTANSSTTETYITLYDDYGFLNMSPGIYYGDSITDKYPLAGGALGDFTGRANTTAILSQCADGYLQSITNESSTGCFPAAALCNQYHTNATEAGSWYLGSAGEMAFITANIGQINYILYQLGLAGHVVISSIPSGKFLWTSTVYNANRAYYVYNKSARSGIGYGDRNAYDDYYVLAITCL